MSKEEKDCPVEEATCIARMETVGEQINGIKNTVYAVGVTITIALSVLTFILKLWRP